METRANFVLIGAFTLAAVVGAFLFVMWIAGYGTAGSHRHYQIVFNGSVSGLSTGANVLFNGLKFGEVTGLGFVKGNPSQVVADIDVTNPSAPINSETKARLETQGLTGTGTVALIGAEKGAELAGNPPVIPSLPTATLADLQTKAGYVLDLMNKLIVDNAQPLHQTLENVETFSMALSSNASGVDAAMKSITDLGKSLEPLATRLQSLSDNADKLIAENADDVRTTMANVSAFSKTMNANSANIEAALKGFGDLGKAVQPAAQRIATLSEDADKLVRAVDAEKVKGIVDTVQTLALSANSTFSRADRLFADNSDVLHSAFENVNAFAETLADNRPSIDAGLKGFGDLGKRMDPISARLQSLSENADKLVKSIDAQKVQSAVGNAQTFTQALAESSGDYKALVRDGAALAARLNDASKGLSAALADADAVLKSLDAQKIGGIVDSVSNVAATVQQNRGNIDQALKNAADMMAKLNGSADKVDGLLTSAQSFLGSPGTKSAMGQIGDAAQSVKKLADNLDARVKEISVGLNRFSNSGLREYEGLAIQGRRVLDDIDRVVRSFERNPTQLIWGNKSSLPEYRGQ